MKRIAWQFAASSVVLGATTVGLVNGIGPAPAAAFQSNRQSDERAAQLFEQAGRAIADNKLAEAIPLLEEAVTIAPRDAGYRLMLADAYMKSGRFQSAESAYRDVLTIDPSRTRAGLALALMQVANGRPQAAMSQLEALEGVAPAADLGLAYALAGAPQRAVDLLEPAARSPGATPRTRQNLALAYAFGGDWQRARSIAAQDVAPSELTDRMTQWAALAQRSGSPDQVATVLGVVPSHDAGQPVQLALNPGPPAVIAAPQPVAVAAAEPVAVEPVYAAEEPAPVQTNVRIAYAEAQPPAVVAAPVEAQAPAVIAPHAETVPPAYADPLPPPVEYAAPAPEADPVPVPAPEPVASGSPVDYAELEASEWGLDESGNVALPKDEPQAEPVPVRVQYAAAAETLSRPDPVVLPAASRAMRSIAPMASRVFSAALPGKRVANGQFVVQIGAFSSAVNASRAWEHYSERFNLSAEQPVTMTIDHNGRLLHRVAISGFGKRSEASQVCRVIQARGGECFVRDNAGDAAIDWAARYARNG